MKKIILLFFIVITVISCTLPLLYSCDTGTNNSSSGSSSTASGNLSSTASSSSSSTRNESSQNSSSQSSQNSSTASGIIPPESGSSDDSSIPDGGTSVSGSGSSAVSSENTAIPLFARFDFGEKSSATVGGQSSHQSLLNALKYDADAISVDFTDDTLIITAKLDGTFESAGDFATLDDSRYFMRGTKNCYRELNTFSLNFDNFIDYDLEGELLSGYGSWAGYPFTYSGVGDSEAWRGYHQYMKIRLKNNTPNNKIALQFNNSDGFYSTQFAVFSVSPEKNDFQTYIYDLCYAASYPSGKGVLLPGQNPGNNWTWKQNTPVSGLRFHLLGSTCSYANAYLNNKFEEGESASTYDEYAEYFGRLDTRQLIKAGNSVEIDYIVFGSSPEQLSTYKSALELSQT